METIVKQGDYRIDFNGSKTYMVIDSANQCHFATTSKVKAVNRLNIILKSVGLTPVTIKKTVATATNVFTLKMIDVFKPVAFEFGDTLKQLQKTYKTIVNQYYHEGGDSVAGAYVYNPSGKVVAWISPNGRVWKADNEKAGGRGGLTEYTKEEILKTVDQL